MAWTRTVHKPIVYLYDNTREDVAVLRDHTRRMKHLEDGLHRLVSGVGSLLVSILDVSVVPVTATRHTNETAPTKRLLSQRRSAHSDRKTQVASPRGRPKACLNLPNLSWI